MALLSVAQYSRLVSASGTMLSARVVLLLNLLIPGFFLDSQSSSGKRTSSE
jgi:hypothetical protein